MKKYTLYTLPLFVMIVFVLIILAAIAIAVTTDAAQKQTAISMLKPDELIPLLQNNKLSDEQYKQITAGQLKDEKVISMIKDMKKLDNDELAKAMGAASISVEADGITYKDGKIVHPKKGTLPAGALKEKEAIVTKDGFIIKKGKQEVELDGALENKIDDEGNLSIGTFWALAFDENAHVKISGEGMQTNAAWIMSNGKKIENPNGALYKVTSRANGDLGVEVLVGNGVKATNEIGKGRIITTTIDKGNKYYAINNNQKHGLQLGGTLLLTDGKDSHELVADAHSIYVLKDGKLAKVVAGYQAEKLVNGRYTESSESIPKRRFTATGGDGFTIYKQSGLTRSAQDPGAKIEYIDNSIDIDEKTLKGTLSVSASGADVIISKDGIKTRKLSKDVYIPTETTISAGKYEVSISKDGDVEVGNDQFRTAAKAIRDNEPRKQTGNSRVQRVQEAIATGTIRPAFSSEMQERIVGDAERLIDTPYGWGGRTKSELDCSGLVFFVYNKAGYKLPVRTADQYYKQFALRGTGTTDITHLDKASKGMVCFWKKKDGSRIQHTGIYAGNSEVIHASSTKGKIVRVPVSGVLAGQFAGCHQLMIQESSEPPSCLASEEE